MIVSVVKGRSQRTRRLAGVLENYSANNQGRCSTNFLTTRLFQTLTVIGSFIRHKTIF